MMNKKFNRKKVGLALGNGGARGLAHIGVIKSLVKNNIPIDLIAGTSVGALIGGMYVTLGDIWKVEKIWQEMNYKDFLKLFTDPSLQSGVFRGDKPKEFLYKHIGKVNIEDAKIPFQAVATDIVTGQIYRFKKGDLVNAVRASGSLPFFLRPVSFGKKVLIDGATSEPVPVATAKKMGADIVIAVNLDSVFFDKETISEDTKNPSTFSILRSTLNLFRYHLAQENVRTANIVINPNIPEVGLHNFVNGQDIINKGEFATDEIIKDIKKLI